MHPQSNGRKICVVTGSRAEYGLLKNLMHEIQQDTSLKLQVVATGSHLSELYGSTYKEIEADGFRIDAKLDLSLGDDSALGICKAMGRATGGFADLLASLKPDLLVLYGDRYEIFACGAAAMIARIPIAHINGGDVTEGAYDEAIRHSLTKMSHLHFVTNVEAAARVRQLGEDPKHIYLVGSTGIDAMKKTKFLSREQLATDLQYSFKKKNLLITFHPETLNEHAPVSQLQELLGALQSLGPDVGLIFTKPNADTGGVALIKAIDDFAEKHANAKAYSSLGQVRYWSLIRQVDAVVGNSSSGIYEVPSLKKPTVNIGDRQLGRACATSVINSVCRRADISKAIDKALATDCSNVENPYEQPDSSKKIKAILSDIANPAELVKKKFYDLEKL